MTGFSSKIWGPSAWLFLHLTTLSYKPSLKKHYSNFFHSLQYVLPCSKCRKNYSSIIRKGPLKLTPSIFKNKSSLSHWFFKVHDKANKKNIKKNIEKLFKVNVIKVNIINQKSKLKMKQGKKSIKKGYKKAIITLKKGQSIDLTTGI